MEVTQKEDRSLYLDAIQQALPPVTTNSSAPALPQSSEDGNWLTRLVDGEGRLHHDIMLKIDHIKREGDSAEIAIGEISNVLLASVMETEAGYRRTLDAYRDEPLAMALAPTIVQLARAIHLNGAQTIQESAVQAISHQIGRRR